MTIEDDVFIGMHSLIRKGIRIGRGSVVGVGSVVTRDEQAGAVGGEFGGGGAAVRSKNAMKGVRMRPQTDRFTADYLIVPPRPVQASASGYLPKVSFCIPTKNRERTIGACLASIRAQEYPNVEIVVVDNGSSDDTMDIARRSADVVASCAGPLGAVRQYSVDLSSGQILALFDDDIVIPHCNWLAVAVAAFANDARASTVWPALMPPPGSPWLTRCFFDLNDAIFFARRKRYTAVFGGGNSLFLRSALEAIGGFNLTVGFGEDFELAARLKAAGYRVIWHNDPLIHDSMTSLREILRKQQWGATAVRAHGTALLAQSYRDMLYEQIVVGSRAMIKGLAVERKAWWLTYPILLTGKALPYSRAIIMRALPLRKTSAS